jgi:hypothetical protein
MTDATTTLEPATTDTPTAPKAKREAKAKLPSVLTNPAEPTAAPPKPTSPIRAKFAVLRYIARGETIDPNAIVTVVATSNPKLPGSKTHLRFAKYASGKSVKENLAIEGGMTIADLRYDYERGFLDLSIEPKTTKPR